MPPAKNPRLSNGNAIAQKSQETHETRTHERPVPPKGREYPLVLLENGLVSLEETPDYLVPAVQRNAAESPLLRLPAEVRLLIFEYAMGGYEIAVYRANRLPNDPKAVDGYRPSNQTRAFSHELPAFHLPQVCRKIYSETATLGYQLNTFILDYALAEDRPGHLDEESWLSKRNPAQLAAITAIEPNYWDAHVYHSSYEASFRWHLPGLRKIIADGLACPWWRTIVAVHEPGHDPVPIADRPGRIWEDRLKPFVSEERTKRVLDEIREKETMVKGKEEKQRYVVRRNCLDPGCKRPKCQTARWEREGEPVKPLEVVVRKGRDALKWKRDTAKGVVFYM